MAQSTFEELVTHFSGGNPFRKLEYAPDGIPVLAKGDIKPFGRIVHREKRFIDAALVEEQNLTLTQPGDLLMTSRDLTQDADVLGLVSPILSDQPYFVNQGAKVIRIDNSKVYERFFVYWCNSPISRQYMKSIFVGPTQMHIRKQDFLNAPIWLPPLEEQRLRDSPKPAHGRGAV